MVNIYLDGADLAEMAQYGSTVSGFTCNPSLMKKSGVTRYTEFAMAVLAAAGGKPVSFEVLTEDPSEIVKQARKIASWGPNVYVKIPVINGAGDTMAPLIRELARDGLKINVTAVMTLEQVSMASSALGASAGIVSVFAGRIADTGIDPLHFMQAARPMVGGRVKLLWASPRQVYDVVLARTAQCDIITLGKDLLVKCALVGADLEDYSRATVRQFINDAKGIKL